MRVFATVASLVLTGTMLSGCAPVPMQGSDPEAANRGLDRVRQHHVAGESREVIRWIGAACGEANACREVLGHAAESYMAIRQPEAGSAFFAAVEQRYPELAAQAKRHRAFMLEKSLQVVEAEREYRASLALAADPEVSSLLGCLLHRSGRTDDAIEAFRGGLALDPGAVELRYLLGRALLDKGETDAARAVLESAVDDDPDHAYAWAHLGRAHVIEGREEEARSAFRRSIENDPTMILARFMLARLALRAGDRSEATRLLGEIREIEATLGRGPIHIP